MLSLWIRAAINISSQSLLTDKDMIEARLKLAQKHSEGA
jgi:hypothetical protein